VIADATNGAILRLSTAAKCEDGQTFVEYSLIGVLVAVALALTLGILVTALSGIGHAL
jgi:Flp pilus assembly pilin Flp